MISKYEITAAEREAAKDRAHSMCIDKIKQLSEQNSKLLDDKIKLDGKMDELYGEIEQLVIDNVELTEQNKQMKQALKDWEDEEFI